MLHSDHARLASLALPYFDDISDENELHEYLDDSGIDFDENDTLLRRIDLALTDDIDDLLKNGNDEDLNWSEADVELLRSNNDYYMNLDLTCRLIAQKLHDRIYSGGENSEPTA